MLFLSTNVALGATAVPACLPPLSYAGDALAGQTAKVSGWGSTTQVLVSSYQSPAELQSVDIPVVAQADCTTAYAAGGSTITDNMICAGIIGTGGKDSCQGDSGGKLLNTINFWRKKLQIIK